MLHAKGSLRNVVNASSSIVRACKVNRISKSFFATLPSHTVVAMPSLSPTMETGSIAKWNLKVGDKFEVGTSFCEVETDKATVSFDATEEGYIAQILVSSGDIKVGQPILVTVEDASSVAAFAGYKHTGGAAVAAPAAAAPAAAPAAAAPARAAAPVQAAPSTSSSAPAGRVFASPFAKKLARESGSSIEAVAAQLAAANSVGSGPNGRIVAADVQRASTLPRASAAAAPTTTAAPVASKAAPAAPSSSTIAGVYSDFQLSELAQSLAARQTHAKQVVPHYYLSVELNLAQLLKLRATFNAQAAAAAKGKKGAVAELSVQDFLVKAAALAMQQVPDVNGSWMDTFVRRYEQVDINLVMGAGSFVATPVLRNVGSRGLASIAAEIAAFEDTLFADDETSAALVQDGDKMAVGTFSIHNLGMYGVKSAAPIVLTPQACALSLGAIVDTVIPATPSAGSDQDWAVAPILTATLSCDHRVVDGAVGAQWLSAFKSLVENPVSMLL